MSVCSRSPSLAGARPLEHLVGVLHLGLSAVAQLVNPLAAVQCLADLLVRLDKALQLASQVPVLTDQHVAVMLKSIDLSSKVSVALLQGLVGEAQVVLLASGSVESVLSGAALALEVVQVSR